ncbi:hypothetical protein ALC57_08352 [Trachymyrmex cornetzi]|uniref:RNase H type-1 domain-containing protein n=2 Tax=Trachymyrmex cornetzi TaxID=471704 RepID=A0A151J6Z2_9HYME|nr:hypothetical protein ALC57_08352 [Trachymyrmex cornetzi]
MEPTIFYTDGSKSDDSIATSAGVVLEGSTTAYSISLPRECFSFTAEAFAIKAVLDIIYNEFVSVKKDVIIFSDCQAVIKAINNNEINVYKNMYIVESRKRLFEINNKMDKNIIIVWTPAHIGVVGNEVADRMAKEGSKEEILQGDIVVPLLDVRSLFRQNMWNNTQSTIVQNSRAVGTSYFKNFYNPAMNKPWFAEFDEERAFVTFVNRLRSNHYNLNESLARKGYVDSARCDCGYEIEDVDHVIWRCSKYDETRIRLDLEFRSRGIFDENSIFTWIKRGRWTAVRIVYNFFRSINRVI